MACFSPSQPLEADAVISDAGVDVGPRRAHEGEPAAEAEADAADLSALREPRARVADRCLQVGDGPVLVEPLHQPERLLELLGQVGIELDARLDPPEQVRRDADIAQRRHMVALAANALVDAENLLDDDDRALGRPFGPRQIGAEACFPVQRCDLDRGHGALLACNRRL